MHGPVTLAQLDKEVYQGFFLVHFSQLSQVVSKRDDNLTDLQVARLWYYD